MVAPYIIAPPRMRLYEEYSSRIYATCLKYVAPEDIIVYSVDEVFIDGTNYLHTYVKKKRKKKSGGAASVVPDAATTAATISEA